jgi:hypothetical protein
MAEDPKAPNTQIVSLHFIEEKDRPPRKRHSPKSERAIAVLKDIFPPDGRPARSAVSDSQLERKYHEACDRLDISERDRVGHTQLLRCAGRKK